MHTSKSKLPGPFRGDPVVIWAIGHLHHTTRARVHSVTRGYLLLELCWYGIQPRKPGKCRSLSPCPLSLQQGTAWPHSAGWVVKKPIGSPAKAASTSAEEGVSLRAGQTLCNSVRCLGFSLFQIFNPLTNGPLIQALITMCKGENLLALE